MSLPSKHPPQPAHELVPEQVPGRGRYTESARIERLAFARKRSGAAMPSIDRCHLDAERLSSNVENMIGSVEIPVGLAGPLRVRGESVDEVVYVPLATTEGALVASAARGARAITACGGATSRVLAQRMVRVPYFAFATMTEVLRFTRWLEAHERDLQDRVSQVSRHARLVEIDPVVAGRQVHVRFIFETGDAAGQNMTTTCTWHLCQWILSQLEAAELAVEDFFVEANMSSDKKVSFSSFLHGRGTRVSTECFLDGWTIRRILKVSPDALLRACRAGQAGSAHAGMIGFNLNIANVIAAVFAATGQDIACVHESSIGVFEMEPWEDGVYVCLTLPSLIIGTVGGGTHLPNQHDFLDVLGCVGGDKMTRLAEIIAAACMALDLSTLSAVAAGQFASAHERLGRNRPVSYLEATDLTAPRFEAGLKREGHDATVDAVEPIDCTIGSSVITELTAQKSHGKLLGFFPRRLSLTEADGSTAQLDVMLKIKPLDREVMTRLQAVAQMCGEEVGDAYRAHRSRLGLQGCHRRELAIYRETDPRFRDHVPAVHGVWEEPKRELYGLVLEKLDGLELMDQADDLPALSDEHFSALLSGLAKLHAVWFDKGQEVRDAGWLGQPHDTTSMVAASDLWTALADHAHGEFPELVDARQHARWTALIHTIPSWWPELAAQPQTLIHNDFNPRNVAFRRDERGVRICAYDWELATMHAVQHDLAEYLCFALGPDVEADEVVSLVRRYRRCLERETGVLHDEAAFLEGFVLCLRDLLVNRMGLYVMAHTTRDYPFLPRTLATCQRLLDLLDGEF